MMDGKDMVYGLMFLGALIAVAIVGALAAVAVLGLWLTGVL